MRARVSDFVGGVRGTFSGLDDKGLTQTLREIESLSRCTHAVMLELVAETDSRGIAAREGFGSTARLLAGMLQLSAAEARMRVEHAAMVSARRTLTGETMPLRLPATAAALTAGEIGTGQLRVITETMAALPASVPEAARERAEADLAGHARDFDPRWLRVIAHRILANLDPDGPQPSDEFPTSGGEPPHGTVIIDWDALRAGIGTATMDYGQLVSARDARRLACDCKLIPVVLGGDSEPLDVGRAMRTVPLGIRRALIARDGGCSFPGCDRPPGLCATHHAALGRRRCYQYRRPLINPLRR